MINSPKIIAATNFGVTGGILGPRTNEGKAAREYNESRGQETMTGETHPRNSYPAPETGYWLKKTKNNKDGIPGKVWFPCAAGTVANCGTSA